MDPVTMQALLGLVGTSGQAQGEAASSRLQYKTDQQDLKEKKRQFDARKAAYDEMLSQAGAIRSGGENQFEAETGQALPELVAAREAVRAGSAEGMQEAGAQTKANLTQMGVRGGQAANLLARQQGQMGVGMQRQLDEMALNEADKRRQLRAGLFGQKTMAGVGGMLSQFRG